MKYSTLKLKFMSVFVVIALFTACGKGCQKSGTSSGQMDPLTLIPASNNLLLGVNWKKLSGTPFFQEAAKDMPVEAKEISKDVNDAVIAISMRGSPAQPPSGLAIVSGNFDEKKIVGLIEEAAKKQGATEVKKETVEGKTVYLSAKDPNIGMVFLSPNQAAWGQVATLKETLALLNKKGASVQSNKELVSLFNKRNANKLLWGAAILPSPPAGQASQPGDPMAALQSLKDFSIGVDYNNKDLSIDWSGSTQDATQAQNLVNMVNSYKTIFGATLASQQPALGQVIQGAQIGNQDKSITISLKLNEEVLKQLSQKMNEKAPALGATPATPAPMAAPTPTGQAAAPANQ